LAFVITPSSASLTQSNIRTFSVKQFVWAGSALLFLTASAGFALGYALKPPRVEQVLVENTPVLPVMPEQETGPLVDRLGELSARLIRLESEAMVLGRNLSSGKDPRPKAESGPAATETPSAPEAEPPAPSHKQAGPQASLSLRTYLTDYDVAEGGPLQPPVIEGLGTDWIAGGLSAGLDVLERDLDRVEQILAALDDAAIDRNNAFMAFPARSPLPRHRITSGFGNRLDPFSRSLAFHKGIDYPAPTGTPIVASGGGKVIESGYHSEYGRRIDIDHGNGLVTRYAHASRLLVQVGDVVTPGQKIAEVGSTGRSTGAHLHFEVLRNGQAVNPRRYLMAHID
jgi:murein DD-endopeptidase MepM/ murein hydrolase activator NlpD